jgi:hypothetical protein
MFKNLDSTLNIRQLNVIINVGVPCCLQYKRHLISRQTCQHKYALIQRPHFRVRSWTRFLQVDWIVSKLSRNMYGILQLWKLSKLKIFNIESQRP